MSVDPLTNMFTQWSSYSYGFCNPIRFIDPTGMSPDDYYYDKEGKQTDYVKNEQPDKFFVQDDKGTTEHKVEIPM